MAKFRSDCALYLGTEEKEQKINFIIEDNCFVVIEVEDGFEKEDIQHINNQFKQALNESFPQDLNSFEALINTCFFDLFKVTQFSFAAACIVGEIVYVLTKGKGSVYLARGDSFNIIISSDNKASGYVKNNDILVLCSYSFLQLSSDKDLHQSILSYKEPKKIVSELATVLKQKSDIGAIASFVKITQEEEDIQVGVVEKEESVQSEGVISSYSLKDKVKSNISKFKTPLPQAYGKLATIVVALILLAVLVYSGIFGYRRYKRNQLTKYAVTTIQQTREILKEAQNLSILRPQKAQELLTQAEEELKTLQEQTKEENISEVNNFVKEFKSLAKEIKHEESANTSDFFGLALIDKKASGSKMYISESTLVVLDKKNSNIYSIDIEKKSNESIKDASISQSQALAVYNDQIYFINKEKGIYQVEDLKAKQIIKPDKDWKTIKDLWIYNGNLYLLDSGIDEIYKYLVAQDGFSAKTSYFKSDQAVSIQDPSSIAIDSSVYLLSDNIIYKYVSGIKETLTVSIPDADASLTKLFTNKDVTNLYIWSKEVGKIYIFSKEGEFEKQVVSSLLRTADDFVVIEGKGILILQRSKIYLLEI